MSTGISIVLKLLTALGAVAGLTTGIGFILWIISVVQKDTAHVRYIGQQKNVRMTRVKLDRVKTSDEEEEDPSDTAFQTALQVKKLIFRMEIDEQVYEEEYNLRKQKVQKYGRIWFASLIICGLLFYITAIIKEDYLNSLYGNNYTTSSTTTSTTQNRSSNQIFQLPDGTIVSADDVYIGADGLYYLKPGVDPYTQTPAVGE